MNAKKKTKYLLLILAVISLLLFIATSFSYSDGSRNMDWQDYLYTPTDIVFYKNNYYIQDCWNGRIVYSSNLSRKIREWSTLSEEISGGHSFCVVEDYLIYDDSNANKICVYSKANEDDNQELHIDNRPHYILWDDFTNALWVISSYNGQITKLKFDAFGNLNIVDTFYLSDVAYMRSATIIEGYMYVPDAFGVIHKIDYANSFGEIEKYIVDYEIGGMNQLTQIDDYFYLTVYSGSNFDLSCPSKILRAKDITDFTNNNYEDITDVFGINGTPYFIRNDANSFFLTEIDSANGICRFNVNDNVITNVEWIYRWDDVCTASKERKADVIK